jgi:hypothetical protein
MFVPISFLFRQRGAFEVVQLVSMSLFASLFSRNFSGTQRCFSLTINHPTLQVSQLRTTASRPSRRRHAVEIVTAFDDVL